jgi:hypothetical protein
MCRTRRTSEAGEVKPLLLVPLLLALAGCGPFHHSPGWKRADLDRNRFDLAMSRGVHTGATLATWASPDEVVAAGGTSHRGSGGDLYVVLDYRSEGATSGFGRGRATGGCWRFTTPDGYDVAFRRVRCP